MTTYAIAKDSLNFGIITAKQESHLTPQEWLASQNAQHLTVIAAHFPVNRPASPDDLFLSRKAWNRQHQGTILFLVLPKGGGGGGGGSNPIAAIASLALVAFAPWAAGLVFAQGSLAFTALSAGIGLVGNMLISKVFSPQPEPNNQALPQASPTYSSNVRGNAAQLGNTVPIQYGQLTFPPDWIQTPYTVYKDDNEYLCLLYCLGVGWFDIENYGFGIGLDLPLSELDNVSVQRIYKDNHPANHPLHIPITVGSSTQSGVVHEIGLLPPVTYKANDLSNLQLENSQFTRWIYPVPRYAEADKLVFNIGFTGLGRVNDSNGFDWIDVAFEMEAQRIDNSGNEVGHTFGLGEKTIGKATPDTVRHTLEFDVPAGRYRVRLRRKNQPSSDTRVRDKATWLSCLAHNTNAKLPSGNTYLALKVKATGQLSGNSQNQFYVKAERILPPVHQSLLRDSPSSSPYIAAIDLVRAQYGLNADNAWSYLPEPLDIHTLESQRDTGIYKQDVHLRLDTETNLMEAVALLLKPIFALPYVVGGSLYFAHNTDKDKKTLELNESIVDYSESIDLPPSMRPDGLIVEFFDSRYNRSNQVICKIKAEQPTRTETLKLFGITDINDAYRHGMTQLLSALLQTHDIKVTTNNKGRIPLPLDKVSLLFADTMGEARTGWLCDVVNDGDFMKLTLSDDPLIDYSASPSALMSIRVGDDHYRNLRIDPQDEPSQLNEVWIRKTSNPTATRLIQAKTQNHLLGDKQPATYSIVDAKQDDSINADNQVGVVARVLSSSRKDDRHITLNCVKDEPLVYQSFGHAMESNPEINQPFNAQSNSSLDLSVTLMPAPYPTKDRAFVRFSWRHQAGAVGYQVKVADRPSDAVIDNEYFFECNDQIDFSSLRLAVTPYIWQHQSGMMVRRTSTTRIRTFNLHAIDNSVATLSPAWIPNIRHTHNNANLAFSWDALTGAQEYLVVIEGFDDNWQKSGLLGMTTNTTSASVTLNRAWRQVSLSLYVSHPQWANDATAVYSVNNVGTNTSNQAITWPYDPVSGRAFKQSGGRISWQPAVNADEYVVYYSATVREYDEQIGAHNGYYSVSSFNGDVQTGTSIPSGFSGLRSGNDQVWEVYLTVIARNAVDSIERRM